MNWDRIGGVLAQIRGTVRECWGEMNHDEIGRFQGQREQLSGRLRERYGVSLDEARRQLREFEKRYGA